MQTLNMNHSDNHNDLINLDAYLKRIGYEGPFPLQADYEVLAALQWHHSQAIPFENLNPLLGLPIKLDAQSLNGKLLNQQRGGYCYEQNGLFKRVLEQIGFRVDGFAAKVIWNATSDDIMRSHKVLRVTCQEGTFLVDVGFGLAVPTGPIPLAPGTIARTPHGRFQLLMTDDGEFKLQVEFDKSWHDLYQFDLQIQQPADYEVFNWYVSTHPESMFVNNLIVSKPVANGRLTLSNNRLTTRSLDGDDTTQILTSTSEIRGVLHDVFNIDVEPLTGLDEVLNRIVQENS